MGRKGWIKLHRRIQDHWIYQEKRQFSRYEAWIDLLMMANHKDNKSLIDGELVTVKKGSLITSIRKLCDKWNWSNTKVNNFLRLLQEDEMITYKSDTKKTVINICNYSVYHDSTDDENDTETTRERHENISETYQKHTNKNDKECIKNDKEIFSSSTHDQNFSEVMNFYQENLQVGITETPYNLEQITHLYDEFGKDLLLAAMKLSAEQEKKGIAFMKGILNNWRSAGVKTLDDARKYEKEFRESRKQPNIIDIKGGKKHDPTDYTESVGDYGIKLYK